jgi:hypothetical protein
MNDLDSLDVQCSWKFEEKGLTKQGRDITIEKPVSNLLATKEKICGNTKVKLKERKLAFECNLTNSGNTTINESKNMQQLCFTSRIDFYGTMGKNID